MNESHSEPQTGDAKIHARVEEELDRGEPLRKIVALFPSKVEGYEYFAKSMTQRFQDAGQTCAVCGRDAPGAPVQFIWRANVHTTKTMVISFVMSAVALLAGHLYSKWLVIGFVTHHRFCPTCRKSFGRRKFFAAFIQQLLFAFLVLMLFVIVPALVFFVACIFVAPEGALKVGLILAGGLVLLGLIVWGFEKCRTFVIPIRLRQIGQFPFVLLRME